MKNARVQQCTYRERTVEKLVNVTAHCCCAITSPLTVPLPLFHISAFPTDGRTDDAHGRGRLALELKICLVGKVELRNIAVPQIYSFQHSHKNSDSQFRQHRHKASQTLSVFTFGSEIPRDQTESTLAAA